MKNKAIVINYNGYRIALDTVAGYMPTKENARSGRDHSYGILFYLRSGENMQTKGNDRGARQKLLTFLDKHFATTDFTGEMCDACVNRASLKDKECYKLHNCDSYGGHAGFKRDESLCQITK